MNKITSITDETRQKIAVISFIDPFFGLDDGGKQTVLSSLRALTSEKKEVDFFGFYNKNETKNTKSVLNGRYLHCNHFKVSKNPFLFFSKFPFCVARRWNSKFSKINWNKYDLVIFEGEQVYRAIKAIAPHSRKIAIRMHDIESQYRFELARSEKGLIRFLNRQEGKKFLPIETRLLRSSIPLLFVSTLEMETFASKRKKGKEDLYFAPPTFDFCGCSESTGDYMLAFGAFSLDNNAKSMQWFLKKVFSSVEKAEPSAKLLIAGNISESTRDSFISICPNVKILGYVKDIKNLIASAKFVVCPILYGAGIKVKLVESLSYGKLVIANEKAVEGSTFQNGKHLLVAHDEQDFANLIIDNLRQKENRNFSDAIRQEFDQYYSSNGYVRIIEKIIDKKQ